MLILNCEIQGQNFVFINTYAPNTEIEQVEFFEFVYRELIGQEISENVPIIFMFNKLN